MRSLHFSITGALLLICLQGFGQGGGVALPPDEYDALKAHGTLPPGAYPLPGAPPDQHTALHISTDRDESPCDCWVEPDNTYLLAMSPNDDGSSSMINIPFPFDFYGQNYTTLYINNNGNISFGQSLFGYSSSAFPLAAGEPALVAPFWADVDTRGSGQVRYKVTPTAIYVNWIDVGYYSQRTDKLNTFQVILTDGHDPVLGEGKNVGFCYQDMQWTTGSASCYSSPSTCTYGNQTYSCNNTGNAGYGYCGTPATVGTNRGNGLQYVQFGRFDHPGTDYDGAFGNADGISWLDNKNFVFNTYLLSNNTAPIASSVLLCDTLRLCLGDTLPIEMLFISPESDQITTATDDGSSLLGYQEISHFAGSTAVIEAYYTALEADTGFHVIHYTAMDDGIPPLTTTVDIVMQVFDTTLFYGNDVDLCENDPVSLFSYLQGQPHIGGTWSAPDSTPHSGYFDPATDPDGAYTYTYAAGTHCEQTAVVNITKHTPVHAGGDTTMAYCSWDYPDDLFARIPGAPEVGGAWTGPDGLAFNGTLDPGTSLPGVYQYFLQGQAPCPNDTAFITVAIPQAVHAGTDSSIVLCRDAAPFSMQSRLGGTPDNNGKWTDVNGTMVPDLFDPANGLIGVYTYTVTAVLPCPDQSAVLTINLDALPQAGPDSSLVICANGGNTPLFPLLGGDPDTGGHWLTPQDSLLTDGILHPSTVLSGNYDYVTIGPGTCSHLSDTATVNIRINPLPVISFTADPDSGCNPLEVNFINTTDSIYVGNSCVWNFGDGSDPVDNCGAVTHHYTEAGWYHLKLRITTPQGCTDQLIAPGAVLVDPAPKAHFVFTPDPATAANNTLVFTATDPHAVNLQWSFPNGTVQLGRQATHTFPNILADDYIVCLSVQDRYGCADTLCDTIPVLVPNLWVPKAFTPDGNDVNEIFKPITLDMVPEDYHLWIFDRWGQLLFETTDPDKGWDGSGNDGGRTATGVYVWRLTFRPIYGADKLDRFGTVTLLR